MIIFSIIAKAIIGAGLIIGTGYVVDRFDSSKLVDPRIRDDIILWFLILCAFLICAAVGHVVVSWFA